MRFLSWFNIPLLGFLAFSVRLSVLGAAFPDALALFAFSGLYAFSIYAEKKAVSEAIPAEELKKEIESVKTSVSSLKLAVSQRR